MYKIIFSTVVILAVSSVFAHAAIQTVLPDKKMDAVTGPANIFFSADVSDESISDLAAVIDTLSVNFPNVEKINLFINSSGGDVAAGQVGYWAIKNSRIPISTINIAEVSSAATFLFCASDDRGAMPGSQFLFHPTSSKVNGTLFPDDVSRLKKSLDLSHRFDTLIYKTCLHLDETELHKLSVSQYFTKQIDENDAQKVGLISKISSEIKPASASFYITGKADDDDDDD